MRVLISNDDGIESKGIKAIAEKMAQEHKVLVVAPDGNRSACSHSLTISNTIKLKKENTHGYEAYSLSGTPADCIKFANIVFKDFNADIVVSGINKGHNLGSDILYSGTVSIACEASYFGSISFAVSAYNLEDGDYNLFADYTVKIINYLLPISKSGDIWNINFPDNHLGIKGVKLTSLGKHIYSDRYVKVTDEDYMLAGEPLDANENEDCDIVWCNKGYVTVTPILFNKTDYNKLNEVKSICEELSL